MAIALVALGIAAAVGIGMLIGQGSTSTTVHTTTQAAPAQHVVAPAPPPPTAFAVGVRMITVVDPSRVIREANGVREPRELVVTVRYPALGPVGRTDIVNATPATADGPFPLVVFGHGFDVTPALYARLLQAWARAGYVVAAPTYPLSNPDAPGGPDENDLVNQPADDSLVITRMLSRSVALPVALRGLSNPAKVAVAGQSDGETRRSRSPTTRATATRGSGPR